MHHKVILIDDVLFLGSYNFQGQATLTNSENLVRIVNATIYDTFMLDYNRLRNMCHMYIRISETSSWRSRIPYFKVIAPLWIEFRWFLAPLMLMSLMVNCLWGYVALRARRRGHRGE
jgi:phosphatidylserine/phosphatidylglycerophosphate/cardiolipin synthase-like enzyme